MVRHKQGTTRDTYLQHRNSVGFDLLGAAFEFRAVYLRGLLTSFANCSSISMTAPKRS